MPGAACATSFTDNRQHDIFRCNARRGFALDFNFHGLRTTLFQGLRCQYVFNFGSADTKGQCAKRAVGGGMRVAADNGHPRQCDALFRPHYVDDPLIRVIQVIQLDAKFFAVFDQLLHLDARHFTAGINVFGLSRDVVIHGGEGFARLTYRATVGAQTIERLR